MPAEMLTDLRWEPYPKAKRTSRFALLIVLSLLAGLAFALVHDPRDSTGRVIDHVASPAIASDTGLAAPPVATSAHRAGDDNEIDALTGSVAKRYRVSGEAMRELVDTAYHEARRNRLDPLLIVAIIAIESRFNPIAQSEMGAMGLMQIIPQYHADKFAAAGGGSVLDPRVNIQVGSRVLKEYIVRGGTETAGLQLYNGSADDASNNYANKVIAERQRLQAAIRRARAGPIA